MKRLSAFFARLLLIAACVVITYAAVVASLRYKPLAGMLLAFLTWRQIRGWRGSGWAHGTARWAGMLDLFKGGLLAESGLILGRVDAEPPTRGQALGLLFSPGLDSAMACRLFLAAFLGGRWAADRMIRLQKHVHLATFAPTGRGKGVSVIIPNLLALPGSVVVTDPKGELFKLTAEHRRKRFKHRVIRLDPFGLCGPGSDCFNPLSCIDPQADDFLDQCRDTANMLVVRQGTEHEPHWNDAAELVLTAFIAFVCGCETDPDKRNLGVVRGIVSSPDSFKLALSTMQKLDNPVIKQLGSLLEWFKDKELGSVLTTVQRHTQFLDSPAIAANTAASSFDPRELRGGHCSLYLIVPLERLVTLAPLMRLWIGTTVRSLSRAGADERHQVLFLLDEAAHLGKIQALEDAVTLMRGMGIRLWFFFQSLGQLKACYGDKADVLLDNFETQQYFGTNSYEAAEAISRRIGEFTLETTSYNENHGWSRPDRTVTKEPQAGSHSGGSSYTATEMARRLIKPEEILCLPDDTALLLHRNLPVIPARLLKYYSAPEFRRGRTGAAREGIFAMPVMAAIVLVISLIFASVAEGLPEPPRLSQAAAHRKAPKARLTSPPASPPPRYVNRHRPAPRRRSRSSSPYLPSRSGFLIPIR
jgi:type IV secretion system protein VirD4